MNGMNRGRRRVFRSIACGLLVAGFGCGSREVQIPVVKEESLSAEQKAQLDRVRNAQAEAFRRAGMDPQAASTPADFAQQRLDADQMNQAASRDAEAADSASP